MATAKFYTTQDAVNAYLGGGLTSDQLVQAYLLLPIAEQYIDLETKSNGGWMTGPISNEQYDLTNIGSSLYLRSTPVASIQSVQTRTYQIGDTPTTLVAGTDYELIDANRGLLALSRAYGGYPAYSGWAGPGFSEVNAALGTTVGGRGALALVSYTPVQTVPPLISQAATEIVAFWLQNNINPGEYGVTSLRSADEAVGFSAMKSSGCFPANIDTYLIDFQQTIL